MTSISLLELNFCLGQFTDEDILKTNMRIDIGWNKDNLEKDGFVASLLKIDLSHEKLKDFKFHIKMQGSFKVGENLKFNIDDFLNVNGPAIVYPYVRQVIRHTSLEANQQILLPVVDFVALHEVRKKNKEQESS